MQLQVEYSSGCRGLGGAARTERGTSVLGGRCSSGKRKRSSSICFSCLMDAERSCTRECGGQC